MKIKISVDATPIVSALIGGASRSVFFDGKFDFITTRFTIEEVKKYVSTISEKSGVGRDKIHEAIYLLPLKVFERSYYENNIKESKDVIGERDIKDVDILALSFKENCYVWSEDKHFRNLDKVNLIRTKDLV